MHVVIHLFNGHLLSPHYVIVPVLDAGDTAGKKIEISQCSSAFIPIREPDIKEFPVHITISIFKSLY